MEDYTDWIFGARHFVAFRGVRHFVASFKLRFGCRKTLVFTRQVDTDKRVDEIKKLPAESANLLVSRLLAQPEKLLRTGNGIGHDVQPVSNMACRASQGKKFGIRRQGKLNEPAEANSYPKNHRQPVPALPSSYCRYVSGHDYLFCLGADN